MVAGHDEVAQRRRQVVVDRHHDEPFVSMQGWLLGLLAEGPGEPVTAPSRGLDPHLDHRAGSSELDREDVRPFQTVAGQSRSPTVSRKLGR